MNIKETKEIIKRLEAEKDSSNDKLIAYYKKVVRTANFIGVVMKEQLSDVEACIKLALVPEYINTAISEKLTKREIRSMIGGE